MHDFLAMKIQDSFTDVSKINFDLRFGERTSFNLLKKSSIVGVFKDHVSYFPLLINLIVEELNDFWM